MTKNRKKEKARMHDRTFAGTRPGFNRAHFAVVSVTTAVIYFAAARLSLLLAVGATNVTSVWPPSGIALAVILLYGYRMGPAIFIGACAANLLTLAGAGLDPVNYIAASIATALGNMLEGLIGAWLVRRFVGDGNPFDTMKGLVAFIVGGSVVSTMVSASIGVSSYVLAAGETLPLARLWVTWWLGDAVGVLIVSPLVILLKQTGLPKIEKSRLGEAAGIFAVLTAASLIILLNDHKLEYAIIPPLLWIAFRFGRTCSSVAILIVSAIAVASTVSGAGPGSGMVTGTSLFYLQSYIGVISIITLSLSVLARERNELDRSRLEIQRRLYDIIDFLPDATFAINSRGRVLAWNRAMEELSGVTKKEMLRTSDYEYALPFFGERKPILIDLVLKIDDPSMPSAYEFVEKKGDTLFVERYNPKLKRHLAGAASVLRDGNGAVYGAIESIRDITDRKSAELELGHYKEHLEEIVRERNSELENVNRELLVRIENQDRAEMALAESEKKYRDLVESANSVILRWKPDGSITFFNAYAQKFFGFTENEIIGKSVVGTIVPSVESSGRDLELLMEDIMRSPETHMFNENENIRKNGEKVWIAWTNKPIVDESGSLVEVLSVGNDITARKKTEESLMKTLDELADAKERAEAADRIKSAFLATMSHELRTPLNSIIGFTGIILQGLAGPLNDEQKKQMGMVKNSAQHLLSLINDVLDISKIEAGQLEVHPDRFDLGDAIKKATDTVRPLADKKGLSLAVNVGEGIGAIVSDQRRVEQVLINMLSNAIKFTERGGVTLSVDETEALLPAGTGRSRDAVPAIQFRVADTGIGIRAEDLEGLFQPFRQVDTGLTRKAEGTGLGLAICRRLADILGGDITVESEWGRGSTFTLTVPLRRPEAG
ncbi:MAG TPA: MASE1 domain-containing protein [Spirochaetota bacterium]|nr:MASE1 domain-containing protein [Spirochaetota bacterium]